jgi:hypothetical protein
MKRKKQAYKAQWMANKRAKERENRRQMYVPPISKRQRIYDAALLVKNHFPAKSLKLLSPAKIGKTNHDYGEHFRTLRFKRGGILNIGFSYESAQKFRAFGEKQGRRMCKTSRKHLPFMEKVKQSFLQSQFANDVSKAVLKTMRISCIDGAQTQSHTDTLRSHTHNYVLFHGADCHLKVFRWPNFHSSIVLLKGNPYIAIEYSACSGLIMYGMTRDGSMDMAIRYLFAAEVIAEIQPFGELPFAVVGIVEGKLQTMKMPSKTAVDLIPKVSALKLVSLEEAFAMMTRVEMKRPYRAVRIGKANQWVKFSAWKHRHEHVGNPNVPRTSVFFRDLREQPTSGFLKRNAKKPNYIHITNIRQI